MNKTSAEKAVYRADYVAYPWNIERLELRFEIEQEHTRVRSELHFNRNPQAEASTDMVLDGQELELIRVSLDGEALEDSAWSADSDRLVVRDMPESGKLGIEVLIKPHLNTALEGLYPSGRFLLTQCEAQGFRKITYFPDRPDVMARYDVTIVERQRGGFR
jgi:aminopeptidase N